MGAEDLPRNLTDDKLLSQLQNVNRRLLWAFRDLAEWKVAQCKTSLHSCGHWSAAATATISFAECSNRNNRTSRARNLSLMVALRARSRAR